MFGSRLLDTSPGRRSALSDLLRSDPLDVAIALRIGKGTVRKMRQNLGWAIGYNAVALPIAAGVFVSSLGIMLNNGDRFTGVADMQTSREHAQ